MSRLFSRALAVAFVVACADPVPPAPDAPRPDVSTIRTAHGSVLLAGSAMPGATVLVTREPAFAEGSEPAPIAVDPSTGRWSVEVPLLRSRLNVFVLNTVDTGSRASTSARVEVEQIPARPRSVRLTLSESRVQLGADGTATVRARAALSMGEEGLERAGWHVRFIVPGTEHAQEHETDADGVAEAVITPLTAAGPGQVEATVVENDSVQADVRAFEVLPGPPASATLEISRADGTNAGTTLNVRAGDEVHARVVSRDVSGNVVSAPWTLETTPSDAQVAGGVVRCTRAGAYTIVARVQGGSVPSASATLNVAPGSASSGRLVLVAPATAIAGEPVAFEVISEDAYGNPVEPLGLIATASGGGTVDVGRRRATFRESGPRTLSVRVDFNGVAETVARDVFVHPGPAASVALVLDGLPAPLNDPADATFGDELLLGAVARDAFGNAIPDAPLVVTADRGLLVLGRTVLVPSVPGDYVLNAGVAGTNALGLAAIRVAAELPSTLEVRCPASAIAGRAFTCDAVAHDAAGNVVATPVTWTLTPAATATVSNGSLTQRAAGDAVVTATIAGGIAVSRTVPVTAGAPATLGLTLTPTVVQPGGRVRATATLADAHGNPIAMPVSLSSNAPGAIVAGDVVTNVTAPGTWSVVASIPGLEKAATFKVDPGASSSVRLVVGVTEVTAGQSFAVSGAVSDAFGNTLPDAVTLLVDGATPDGRDAKLESGRLTLAVPGLHEISAVAGSLRDAKTVEVLPPADRTAPVVVASLEGDGRDGAELLVRPGSALKVTLRATDADGVEAMRLRVSGPVHGVVFDAWIPAGGRQVEQVVAVTIPSNLVGALNVAVSAVDAAGNAADGTALAATADFHFDRLTFTGAPAGTKARTVSVDPALFAPGALLHTGTTLLVARGVGSEIVSLGAGGRTAAAYTTGDAAAPAALALLPSASGPNLFAPAFLATGNRSAVQRLQPGASAQLYTSPALVEATAVSRPTGLAIDALSTSTWLYAGLTRTTSPVGEQLGAIASMPARVTGTVIGSGVGAEATLAVFDHHHPGSLCLPPGANPSLLYFTGRRLSADRTAAFVGLYRATVTAGRVVAGTPVTVFEEARSPGAGRTTELGPCVATATHVWFSRWEEAASTTQAGRLSRVPVGCAGACTPSDVVQGTAGASLRALRGFTVADGAGYLSEAEGRVLRITGLF